MKKVAILHSSVLLQGDFDNWNFRDAVEYFGIKQSTIQRLKDYKNDKNVILSKKASRALKFLYDNQFCFHIFPDELPDGYELSKICVADIADYLLLKEYTKQENVKLVLYTPTEKDLIPELSKEDLDYIYNPTTKNPFQFKINQYFIVQTEDKPMLFKVDSNYNYINVPYQYFDNDYFGKIKPKTLKNGNVDLRQLAAIDSLNHNQLTMLTGKSGTGKSHLAVAALFTKLEKHEIEKIYMFCNPVATRDSARLGFYAGTKDQKLLDSQIGNFLAGKLGDSFAVEKLIQENKLTLLPMSDIRGFDTNGKKAGIYITEAQNSTIDLMQLALERVGEDCICIIDGDYQKQVDLDIYSDINNGMRCVSKTFLGTDFYGEVNLTEVHRSKIAERAALMKNE